MDLAKILDSIFSQENMRSCFSKYEERPDQKALAMAVLDSFKSDQVSLIEAGTGTGKSLGYLLPALLWAIETGERVIISTGTIPLQEQLMQKELPLALQLIKESLPVALTIALAKGMTNYLCEMKLEAMTQQISFIRDEDESLLQTVRDWTLQQKEPVTRSGLPMAMPSAIWKEIQADHETCTNTRCRHFSSCHFFRSRKALSDAKLIVVNHHLLLNDLLQRSESNNWSGTAILPPYSRVILDEAHHLEDVALALFRIRVARFERLHLIRKFLQDSSGQKGAPLQLPPLYRLIDIIKKDLTLFSSQEKEALARFLSIDLALQASALEKSSEKFFEALLDTARSQTKEKTQSEGSVRITPSVAATEPFKTARKIFSEHFEVCKHFNLIIQELIDRFHRQGIRINDAGSTETKQTPAAEAIKTILVEITNIQERFSRQTEGLASFFSAIENPDKVVWIEWKTTQFLGIEIASIVSSFDIGPELQKKLFEPMFSSILLSATLTTRGTFSFTKERLGFGPSADQSAVAEAIYPSPFPYKTHALLAIASNMQLSDSKNYHQEQSEAIFSIAKASRGGALVLFTSYGALEAIYPDLSQRLSKLGLAPMKQGDMPRTRLLDAFRGCDNGILFATDSFWEGIDIPGQSLRCVIITKLPFDVPSDPIYQARQEMLEKKGMSSFIHYGLPKAIVKFKQAFGRLIRSSTDYGAVVCLDSRLVQKTYGSSFLSSIPDCEIWRGDWKNIPEIVRKKTQENI